MNAAGSAPGPLVSLAATPHACTVSNVPCHFLHPGQSCAANAVSVFPSAYLRALRVYFPVYVLPALLVHRGALLKLPEPILRKVALGVGRSSLFLGLFISLAMAGVCSGHRLIGTYTGGWDMLACISPLACDLLSFFSKTIEFVFACEEHNRLVVLHVPLCRHGDSI